MQRRAICQSLLAASALQLTGCANRPSYEHRMAARCAASPSILFLAQDPIKTVVTRGERGFPDVIRRSDGTLTFYEWATFSFMHLTEVCQTSPIDYLEATRQLGLEVGSFNAGRMTTVKQAMDLIHVGYDPQRRDATLRAAERAGASYLVVGSWIDSSWDYYEIVQMSGTREANYSRGTTITSKVSGVRAAVEFHVHDVAKKLPLFRKRYCAIEEDRFAVTGPQRVPTVHSFEVRKSIIEGLVADITRAIERPASLRPTDRRVQNLRIAANSPIVIAERRNLAAFVTLEATIVAIDRQDRFTRLELRIHNHNSSSQANVTVRQTKLGMMIFAKSASGQVYTVPADSRPPAALDLRPGEASTMSVTLQNDLGAMGEVAVYVDLDIRSGRASGSRRVTFPSVQIG